MRKNDRTFAYFAQSAVYFSYVFTFRLTLRSTAQFLVLVHKAYAVVRVRQ